MLLSLVVAGAACRTPLTARDEASDDLAPPPPFDLRAPPPDLVVAPPDLLRLPDLTPSKIDLTVLTTIGIGKACADDADCPPGETCDNTGAFAGGYCTRACGAAMPCPGDARCVPSFSGPRCLKACMTSADCLRGDYQCTASDHVCIPVDNESGGGVTLGTRNGAACVTPVLPPVPQRFLPSVQASTGPPFSMETECNLSVDVALGRVLIAYNDAQSGGVGVVRSDDLGATFAAPYILPPDATVDAHMYHGDPVSAVDRRGTSVFYLTWLGFDGGGSDADVFVARSRDGGISFDRIVRASPPGEGQNGGLLDKPWLAVGPVDGHLWLTWYRSSMIRLSRSVDGGLTWSAPVNVSKPVNDEQNLAQVVVGQGGAAYVVWIEIDNALPWGDVTNKIWLQRYHADGKASGGNVLVSAAPDSPAFDDPSVAVDGPRVYVGFISGESSGAWDLRVAASLDGGATFGKSVKVNDDATCATHFHHQIAVDIAGNVQAIWLDNRYLAGGVFHAASPPAGTMAPLAFGGNTFVGDAAFEFTTRRDLQHWLGDYLGLVASDGQLFAAWTDPRQGNVAHIFFAHGK